MESVEKLPVDKAFFRGFKERELASEINTFTCATSYDNYIIVPDGTITLQDRHLPECGGKCG